MGAHCDDCPERLRLARHAGEMHAEWTVLNADIADLSSRLLRADSASWVEAMGDSAARHAIARSERAAMRKEVAP
jgi:hypothetical protein